MIPVTYFRSSSFNQDSFCSQSFYLRYILGFPDPSNRAADKGNIAHKILELLASKKLAIQLGEASFFNDELNMSFDTEAFSLDDAIQWGWDCYTKIKPTIHHWNETDLDFCKDSVYKAMNGWGGFFNPLNRDVIFPEKYFDFVIDEPWAEYEYDGVAGKLSLKGTVDLVCKFEGSDATVEMVDWKTGKRKDWASGKIKEWKDLRDDPQLRIYHYALCQLLPDVEHIIVTIVFMNDGGPYSLDFSREDLVETKRILRQRFEKIRDTTRPKLIWPDWKCKRLCNHFKNKREGTEQSMCAFIKQEIITLGIENVTKKHAVAGASSNYGDGGGRSDKEKKQ